MPVTQTQFRRKPHALLGLIGSPISSSASPAMHEAAGEAVGIRCHYQLIDVAGADPAELARLLYGVRRLGFAGVNVTFPYKEAVVGLLDALSPAARAIGAVNTIVVRDGRLTGHNTDATGFRRAVEPLVEGSRRGPVALIGAGGVGKAIAFALAELGVAEIRVFDVDSSKAAALAALIGAPRQADPCGSVAEALDRRSRARQRNADRHGPESRFTRSGRFAARRPVRRRRRLFAIVDTVARQRQGDGRPDHDRARSRALSGGGRF